MLMRTDPFRELDRLTQQVFGNQPGTWSRPTRCRWTPTAPVRIRGRLRPARRGPRRHRARRRAQRADREGRAPAHRLGEHVEMQVAERPLGVFSRQLFLGDTLDTEHIEAGYDAGVLTLRIPVAEKAKPRKISITAASTADKQINAWRASHFPDCGPNKVRPGKDNGIGKKVSEIYA